ncbi:MAG: hypothetical protein MK160_13365 [Rhodobacteraceae bacterium]|nr:hypothetical protein [Paracoccaceae bacterium]
MPINLVTTNSLDRGFEIGLGETTIVTDSTVVAHDDGSEFFTERGHAQTTLLNYGSIIGLDAPTVVLNGQHQTVINHGDMSYTHVTGFPNAIFLARNNSGNDFRFAGSVTIENTGALSSATRILDFSRTDIPVDVDLFNSGTIRNSPNWDMFSLTENVRDFTLYNSGQIFGGGVRLSESSVVRISNHGEMDIFFLDIGAESSSRLYNYGTITVLSGNVQGGQGSDTIVNSGTIRTTRFDTLEGDDKFNNSGEYFGFLNMGGGDDKLVNSGDISEGIGTGAGADTVVNLGAIIGGVVLGYGNDTFKMAGNGFVNDVIYGEGGDDTIIGGLFDDTMDGGADDDFLIGKYGNDNLTGGSGNDTVAGDDGADVLFGGDDNDRLSGGRNDDHLNGGQDNDVLLGGSGNDTLVGENGRDVHTGGAGEDNFVFSNLSHSAVGRDRDVIRDFTQGEDVIDLSGFFGVEFVFLGDDAFNGISGNAEVQVVANAAGHSVIRIDANGGGKAESEILVRGVTGLEAEDFLL